MEKVYSIVRKTYDRSPSNNLDDLDVNTAIWCMVMNTTFKQQFILVKTIWRIYDLLSIYSWSLWSSYSKCLKNWSRIKKSNLTTIDYKELTWSATSLICEKAFEITNAKTYVFADSVLCLGSMRDEPIEAWKKKMKWFSENNHFKELNRIDGMQTESEWKIFPGFTKLHILEEIQKFMKELQCEPEQFNDRIIFMSCTTTLHGKNKETQKSVKIIQLQLRIMLADFRAVFGRSWDLDQKEMARKLLW